MTGVRCGHVFRDYEDIRTRAGAVANGLAALDVTAGDRVAIYLHNEIAFIEASIGIGMLGAIPVPVNWHWQGAELAYLLDDSDSKVIFADTGLISTAEAVAGDRALIEVAQESQRPTGRHPVYEDWLATQGTLVRTTTAGADVDGVHLRHHGQTKGHRPRADHPRAGQIACRDRLFDIRADAGDANSGRGADVSQRTECPRARQRGRRHRSDDHGKLRRRGVATTDRRTSASTTFKLSQRCSSGCCTFPTRSGRSTTSPH